MGLLDVFNDDNARFSLGLLAAAGPRADGAGFGQRMQDALGGMDTYRQNKDAAAFKKLEIDRKKKEWADQDKESALAPQFYRPAMQGTPGAPASFDMQGYTNALMGISPVKGLALMQSQAKDTLFGKVDAKDYTPDSVARFEQTRKQSDLRTQPKNNNLDAKIEQYEYATRNGYKGSFEQFIAIAPTIMAAAQAPLRNAQTQNIIDENLYNLPQRSPKPASNSPMRGQVVQGYKFKGGNPADQNNWEKQ